MRLPNFFLIGAPKAGTTALHSCLTQHPDVFMSRVKEPLYFAFPEEPPVLPGPGGTYWRRAAIWRPRDYARLFAGVRGESAVGEASPLYIRSSVAAHRIRRNIPGSRVVALLRQPAERAYSSYMFMRQHGIEPEPTFARALEDEERRLGAGWFSGLFHRTNGLYHAQLSTWYDLFPREQIRVYFHEEWRETPGEVLRDLFRFLQVDERFEPSNPVRNPTLLPRSRRLHALATGPDLARGLGTALPRPALKALQGALGRLDSRFNLVPPPPLDPDFRAALTAYYRDDILKLQDLVDRDLSHWLEAA